jgi:tetratricopeptide (TPR) repeat protein
MKKLKFLFLLLIPALMLMFSSCTKESEDSILLSAKTKMEEAKKLETENKLDEAKKGYNEAVEIYKKFLAEYPSSPKAPEVYSSIAKIYVDNLRDYPNAIKYYQELSQKHPATKESKYGMFMIAFIYDEMLKDKEKAKENYRKFLDKYPKDEDANEKMSESARMMLQMLDENRSIEDIIKNTRKILERLCKTEKKKLPSIMMRIHSNTRNCRKGVDDGDKKVPPQDDRSINTDNKK